MDLIFELAFPGADIEVLGASVAQAVAASPDPAWPVVVTGGREETRTFGRVKFYPAELYLPHTDGNQTILAPDALRDQEHIAMDPALLPRLATTLQLLARLAPDGFLFRATWPGSPITSTVEVDIVALTTLVQHSQLCEFTRYRVPA